MLHGPQRGVFDLEFRLPSECADRLEAGEADIGIVPSIELPRQGLELIRGAGIACRGPVRSILLVTKTAPERIRTLAADTSSRTSVALARIVLARRYGAEPRLTPHAPCLPAMLEAADAALIIGDPALRLDLARLPAPALDLGAEWVEMTGLPMVFAVWGCRPAAMRSGLAEAFAGSCRYGVERLEEIAAAEAPPRNLTPAAAREYLTRHIVNELGDREYEGLDMFLRYAEESGILVPTGGAHA
jgi:predicted solute-binding protein